jgi:hypothetical protein
VSTLAEDDSSNGAPKSAHKQSQGPRCYAYVSLAKGNNGINPFPPIKAAENGIADYSGNELKSDDD